ncbi:VOC family protein [Aquabacter cavernae]|uniref:VOC family protein n=1 Tax=Aquabacter cavernae TaxID=2496029 RepID=UPI000F8DE552|nr:VOC family protein [Aquabacter cavernae]
MLVQPYLSLEGRAEEAIEFYVRTLGAQVEMMMRFSEAPPMPEEPAGCAMPEGAAPPPAHKILHASLRIGNSVVMLSDGLCQGTADFKGMALSLTVADLAEAERVFAALAEGGTVQMPLAATFFSPAFGMLADRFGLGWMVVVAAPA